MFGTGCADHSYPYILGVVVIAYNQANIFQKNLYTFCLLDSELLLNSLLRAQKNQLMALHQLLGILVE
jgi:hypothetical protein